MALAETLASLGSARRQQRHFCNLCRFYLLLPIAKKVDLARPHAGASAESIFNIIFEFSAVFTCYLTYYMPIAKKVDLARPRARPHTGAPAESIFNNIFEFSAFFTCYLTY